MIKNFKPLMSLFAITGIIAGFCCSADARPATPVLTVKENGSNVTASWSSTDTPEGYILLMAPYPDASTIYQADMGTLTSISADLWDGAAYYIAVQSYNGNEQSDLSNIEHFEVTLQENDTLQFNQAAWHYDSDNDVYWQTGVGYCTKPETTDYETMGIYVPGAYMNGTANGDGTYTCTVNMEGSVNGYTAETAPIVFPVNTAGYSAQAAPTTYSYQSLSSYLQAGFVYVYAGMRGRNNGYDESGNLIYSGGAPWGVTDLKAAVRYYRYNSDSLPGDTESIFTFGHSGGGAQSTLMGATGDSKLYFDYLESIGAAMYDSDGTYISDAISGTMAWCPITSLDYADEAYEWNMGQFASTGTRADSTWTSALSDDLATSYAEYINALGLTDENGNQLLLMPSETGIYTAGSYYDYLLSVIEQSLNNFLSDTSFPYTASSGGSTGGGGFPGGGNFPDNGGVDIEIPGDMTADTDISADITTAEEISDTVVPDEDNSSSETTSQTFETPQDYIDSLNSDVEWITYDASTNRAKISSVEAFVKHFKSASKDVAAFDDLERGQAENLVFGNDDSDALHFDPVLAALLQSNQERYAGYSDWDSSLIEAYATDLKAVDKLDKGIPYRQNMYNPMYYLTPYYSGYRQSTVAKHWRIHTGIEQGDTASTVEMNLALALQNYTGVEDVEFATVWNQGHTTAERTGDSTSNFIEWVNKCVSK